MAAPPLLQPDSALFLDFDGTLAEIAPRPADVSTPRSLPELLAQLQRALQDAVAVVSGRPLLELHGYLQPARLHGAGLHGGELALRDQPLSRHAADLSVLARALNDRFGSDERIVIEDKTITVALHFRLAPEREAECIETMRRLAQPLGLDVILGKAVVEARPRGLHKGRAIAQLMQAPPFAGRRPVFVGDDTTDEDGFDYVTAAGGVAVKVGEGESRAPHRLADVAAVYGWLAASLRRLQGAERGVV